MHQPPPLFSLSLRARVGVWGVVCVWGVVAVLAVAQAGCGAEGSDVPSDADATDVDAATGATADGTSGDGSSDAAAATTDADAAKPVTNISALTGPKAALFDCTAKGVPKTRLATVPLSCVLSPTCTQRLVVGHRGAGGEFAQIASLNLTGRGWRKADVRLCRLRARVAAEQYFGGTKRAMAELPVETIGAALLCAKLMSYSQGFDLLAAGSTAYNFDIDRAESARIWTGGCIIRARFLDRVHAAFTADPALALLFTSEAFAADIAAGAIALRTVVAAFAEAGVAAPAFAASLGYFETMTQARGSAAMIQAQRDYFGAHTYRRVDSPEVAVHSEWSELAKLPLRS